MTDEEKRTLRATVSGLLDDAEARYGRVRRLMEKAAAEKASALLPTPYPGVPFLVGDRAVVKTYLTVVVDIRDSTEHLKQGTNALSGLERVYYETSALLPACGILFGMSEGKIAEYTGDGVIAFFETADAVTGSSLLAVHARAEDVLRLKDEIVNPVLAERYGIPPLSVGVGLAIGKIMATPIGATVDQRVTAYGQAVFDASKCSKERDRVIVDPSLESIWPSREGGKVRFTELRVRDNKRAFTLSRS